MASQRKDDTYSLITYSQLYGPHITAIAEMFDDIQNDKEVRKCTPIILDSMPCEPRDGSKVMNDGVIKRVFDKDIDAPDTVPFLTTEMNYSKLYGQAIVFKESLKHYIPVMKEIISQKLYLELYDDLARRSVATASPGSNQDIAKMFNKLSQSMLVDEPKHQSQANVFEKIKDFIFSFDEYDESTMAIFDEKEYNVTKAL